MRKYEGELHTYNNNMKLKIQRIKENSEETLGKLYINGELRCYTLEDQHQDKKVMHETRIPTGTYKLALREYGGHYLRYKEKYKNHKGMIQIMGVPNFSDILIHIGNTDADTSGCILVGKNFHEANNRIKISESTAAYLSIYTDIRLALESGQVVEIEILDI